MYAIRSYYGETTAVSRVMQVMGAFAAPKDRILVVTAIGSTPERVIEVVVPQAPLRADLRNNFV